MNARKPAKYSIFILKTTMKNLLTSLLLCLIVHAGVSQKFIDFISVPPPFTIPEGGELKFKYEPEKVKSYETNTVMTVSTPGEYSLYELMNLADQVWMTSPNQLELEKYNTWKFFNPEGKYDIYFSIRNAFDEMEVPRKKLVSEQGNRQLMINKVLLDNLDTYAPFHIIELSFESDDFNFKLERGFELE